MMLRTALTALAAMTLAACMGTEAPAPVTVPEPAPIVVDFSQIEQRTPGDVIAYLGEPTLVRRDDTVQVMLFEAAGCVFEVVFFEPDNGDYFRAHHYSARTRTGSDTDPQLCARQLLESRVNTP